MLKFKSLISRRILILLISINSAWSVSCSTLNKEQCESGDWKHIGLIDGARGRSSEYIEHHRQACQGSRVDVDAYNLGWSEGLKSYCRPEGAYAAGSSGQKYMGVCGDENEDEFKENFSKGRKLFLLKQQKAEINDEIKEERERINKDKSVLNHAVQALNMISGRSPTESLDSQKVSLNKKIYSLESESPIGVAKSQYSIDTANQNTTINTIGAFTGTLFGFGLGHAIQGRYSNNGWKWTLGEIGGIAAMAVAHNEYCTSKALPDGNYESNCENALPGFSILAFLGFRVWQSVDLWSNLSGSEYKTSYQILIKPNGLGIASTF